MTRTITHPSLFHLLRPTSVASILLLSLTLMGCDDGSNTSDENGGNTNGDSNGEEMNDVSLRLSLTGLSPLEGGFAYEGWFVGDDGPVSAGRFNLDAEGSDVDIDIPSAALEGATDYVLTIEPPESMDDPAPSHTHVLAGAWDGSMATVSIDHPAALGDDFTSALGEFFLQTPTSPDADDYSLGIWFITPGDPMSAGLDLPELPDGWQYEGWVAGPDGPVSTGVFVDPAGADSDGAGATAGDEDAPPFPGQDFIEPPMDLLDGEYVAVISVEPMPDDSAAPFAFKPLVGSITDAGAGGVQELDNMAEGAPAGTVTLVE